MRLNLFRMSGVGCFNKSSRMLSYLLKTGVGVVSLVLLFGCAESDVTVKPDVSGSSPAIPTLPESTASSANPIPEPFAEIMRQQDANAREVHDATELAVAQCMKEKGFKYIPRKYFPREVVTRRIGDVKYASQFGFGLTEGEKGADLEKSNPNLKGLSAADVEAYTNALIGNMANLDQSDADVVTISGLRDGSVAHFRSNSCDSVGKMSVYGDVAEWARLEWWVDELVNEVSKGVVTDERWLAQQEQWKSCMLQRGLGDHDQYERLEELMSAAEANGWSQAELLAKEIPIAVGSAECEQKLGSVDLYNKLQKEYEQKVSDANQGILLRFSEMYSAAVKRVNG